MSSDQSFQDLMARINSGDADAAAEIFHRFAQQLISLARRRLDGRMRQKVDPEDVLQSVYKSFFFRQAQGQFDLANWDSLWGLLATITLRKCGHRVEHFRAACRDVQREVAPRVSPEESVLSWQAIARDPTPSEAAILTETVEQVMSDLEERPRQIFQLSLQGHAVPEIAARLGCSERTVQRVLERVRNRLQQLRAESVATM